MNLPWEQFIQNSPLTDAFGRAIVHSLWQITLVGVFCAFTLNILRKGSAQTRYYVALTCMAAALVAFVGTFIWLYEPAQSESVGDWRALVSKYAIADSRHYPMSWNECRTFSDYYFLAVRRLDAYLPLVVAVWCLGALIFSLRLGIGLAYIRRLQTIGVRPVSEQWVGLMQQTAARMNLRADNIRFAESVMVKVPMVIGWLRPMILFPVGLLTALPLQEIEAVLAHELAHIRRRDFIVHLCQSVVEAVLFYHPAVWWMSAQINRERENCCDDLALAVTGNRLAYVKALADLAERITCPDASAYVMAASGKSESGLLQRIRRIVQPGSANGATWQTFPVRFAVVLTLFCLSVFFASATRADDLVRELMRKAQNAVRRTETKLSPLFDLQPADTTRKKRSKLTVIKTDGDRSDTIVVEGDKISVNWENRAVIRSMAGKTGTDSVHIRADVLHTDTDSLLRRLYALSDSLQSGKLPSYRLELDKKLLRIDIKHLPDSLQLRLEGNFKSKEKLLEEVLEELRKNEKLNKKQRRKAEEALQKALEEVQKGTRPGTSVKIIAPSVRITDEFIRIDSLLQKQQNNRLNVQISIDSLMNQMRRHEKVIKSFSIILPGEKRIIGHTDADYFINNKPASREEIENLPPSKIKSVSVETREGKRAVIRITARE